MPAQQSATKFAPNNNKWLLWALIAFAFLGFLDASYLAINHFSGGELSCNLTGGCNEVLTSKWSKIFGIPLSLLGALHYFALILTGLLYADLKRPIFAKILVALTTFGVLFSLWLTYLQIFVIGSLCQYCLFSAANSLILCALAWLNFKRMKV